MLGKLLKNDIKSAARTVVYIYFALLIAMGAMGLSLVVDFMWGRGFASLAVVGIAFAGVFVTIITVLNDFRKTMFGDRGYLTNSLPVTTSSLLLSKFLSMMLWITLSWVIFIASFIGVMIFNTEQTTGEVSFSTVWEMLISMGVVPSTEIVQTAIISIGVMLILYIMVFAMIVIFSLTLSNVKPFSKLGLIGTILIFFVTYGLFAFIGGQVKNLIDLHIVFYPAGGMNLILDPNELLSIDTKGGFNLGLTPLFVQILLSFAMFIVSSELIEKKINIK